MDQHILSIEMRAVTKAVDRYLGESMPLSAKETTGGNAHIIMFLARNEKAALRDYVSRMRANIDRAQHEFEHQTLPQSPVVMAPDQDGAEVANTKEENE